LSDATVVEGSSDVTFSQKLSEGLVPVGTLIVWDSAPVTEFALAKYPYPTPLC
jgi:hypothetical protein